MKSQQQFMKNSDKLNNINNDIYKNCKKIVYGY